MPVNVSLQADKHLHAVNATEFFFAERCCNLFSIKLRLNLTNQ